MRGDTRLAHLHQAGAAKIRVPNRLGKTGLEAVLINTAGGVTGGDRLNWAVTAGAGADLTVTTQACEKIYRAGPYGHSDIRADLRAEAGASLYWWPQETILFDTARLRRRYDIALDPKAQLVMVEATVFGRTAMGEAVHNACFDDRWSVHVGGKLVHREAVTIGGMTGDGPLPYGPASHGPASHGSASHGVASDKAANIGATGQMLARPSVLGSHRAMATMLMVGPRTGQLLTRLENQGAFSLAPEDSVRASLSRWTVGMADKAVLRMSAVDGYRLRQALLPLLAVTAPEGGVPRIWMT